MQLLQNLREKENNMYNENTIIEATMSEEEQREALRRYYYQKYGRPIPTDAVPVARVDGTLVWRWVRKDTTVATRPLLNAP